MPPFADSTALSLYYKAALLNLYEFWYLVLRSSDVAIFSLVVRIQMVDHSQAFWECLFEV